MFYQTSLLLLLLAARAATADSHVVIYTDNIDQQKHLWGRFKSDHSKAYESPAEEKHRFETFLQKLKHIDHLNQEAISMGGNPVFGITKFSDLSPDEFKRMYLSSPPPHVERLKAPNSSAKVILRGQSNGPEIKSLVDWTGIYTTEVKKQGQCGNCWAMAATAQIESDAIRTLGWDRNTPLSAAQLTECAKAKGQNGCKEGWDIYGYYYATKNGITTDGIYPYDLNYYGACDPNNCQSLTCPASSNDNVLQVGKIRLIDTEQQMAHYVQNIGPLTASINATNFDNYIGGLINSCVSLYTHTDHTVQFVGVDTTTNNSYGVPYWKVRNSWGADWAKEGGFFFMKYGVNMCSLLATRDQRARYTVVQYSPSVSPTSAPTLRVVCAMANETSKATITCPAGTVVSNINFASYGTPTGSCGAFNKESNCDCSSTIQLVVDACLNKAICSLDAVDTLFLWRGI